MFRCFLSATTQAMYAQLFLISCLLAAKCGSGPNIYLADLDVLLNHIGTPAKMAQVLHDVCGIEIPEALLKVQLSSDSRLHSSVLFYPTLCLLHRQQSCGWQGMQRRGPAGTRCSSHILFWGHPIHMRIQIKF